MGLRILSLTVPVHRGGLEVPGDLRLAPSELPDLSFQLHDLDRNVLQSSQLGSEIGNLRLQAEALVVAG